MTKIHTLLKRIYRYRCAVAIAVFVVIMVFLDDNSLIVRLKYSRESARLESEINSFRAKYDAADSLLKKMEVDSTVIEHIARKNYFMKRPNEDVYIFKEDQQK